jgi:hypothetical protein
MTSYNPLPFLADNVGVLLSLAGQHLVLSIVSMAVAIVLAVPLGAYVGHLHRFSFLAINGGNVLRALPTLALAALLITPLGFGFLNILICLVVLAFPLVLTYSYTAVEGVNPGIVEAARERVEPCRVHLADGTSAVQRSGEGDDDAARQRRRGHLDRLREVPRAVGLRRRGRPHRASEDHGLSRRQHPLQEPRGLLERVGAVADDDAAHLAAC